MPLSEDTKVLVRSRKKVLQTQIVSLHTLDLVQQHSLERTSSVRAHKAQSSVSVIRLLHLVVQMRRSSLQLLITLFSSVSLEMVQSVEIYYQLQERLYLDLLVLYLVSLLLLVVETNPIQFSSILLVRQQMLYLSRTTRIQIYSISLEGCNREFLFTLLLGSLQLESLQQRNTIGVLSLPLQLNYRKIGDQSIQTTRQYPRLQRTGDSFSESSTTFKLAVNTIQTEIHSLLENPVLLFRLLEQQVLQRSYFPKISISQLRFNTNLLVLLVLLPTRRHQHLRCKLVQSGSSTHSLR